MVDRHPTGGNFLASFTREYPLRVYSERSLSNIQTPMTWWHFIILDFNMLFGEIGEN
jgi:hypothetical protein